MYIEQIFRVVSRRPEMLENGLWKISTVRHRNIVSVLYSDRLEYVIHLHKGTHISAKALYIKTYKLKSGLYVYEYVLLEKPTTPTKTDLLPNVRPLILTNICSIIVDQLNFTFRIPLKNIAQLTKISERTLRKYLNRVCKPSHKNEIKLRAFRNFIENKNIYQIWQFELPVE